MPTCQVHSLDQIPCEFCEELFPFNLLMEHQSGCRPDLLHYKLEDVQLNYPTEVVSKKEPMKSAPKPLVDLLNEDLIDVFKATNNTKTAKSPTSPLVELPTETRKNSKLVTKEISKPIVDKDKKKETTVDQSSAELKFNDTALTFEDAIMQETGTKLMSYGSSVNKGKRTEEEKPSFKVPSLPLLNNADQKEAEDDFDSFSDSDGGESLEDFWKRAEIKNTQRLKNIKV